MKRIISVILAFLLIFSLCSCRKPKPDGSNDAVASQGNSENSDTGSADNSGSGENEEQSGDGSQQQTPQKPSTPQTGGNNTNDQPPSTPQNPSTPDISPPTEIVSKHTALTKDKYYQYSLLTSAEKEVYKKMCAATEKGENIIDVESYKFSKNTINKIHNAFVADNPQYFYLSKAYSYTLSSKTGNVLEFILYFSDGTVEDNFDDDGNAITTADRNVINRKAASFNKKVSEILASIPSNISDLEKEKKIYDYLLDNIVYDRTTADSVTQNPDIVTHAFDVYGAACEGYSVCEGYAKLFQYLCYQVGINATQVHGISGSNHMWNAVQIDNKWYMADPTWDDSGTDRLHYYKFFNVTTAEIEADHTIDYGKLSVPECTATDAAFYNNFAFTPTNNTDLPENFKAIVDYLMLSGEKYLCIYRGVNSEDLSQFIDMQIYSPRSQFRAYIAEKGYAVTLGEHYLITNRYYYISIA